MRWRLTWGHSTRENASVVLCLVCCMRKPPLWLGELLCHDYWNHVNINYMIITEITRARSCVFSSLKRWVGISFGALITFPSQACVPYFEILERWIYKGLIVDPYSEFLVEENSVVGKEKLQEDYNDSYPFGVSNILSQELIKLFP